LESACASADNDWGVIFQDDVAVKDTSYLVSKRNAFEESHTNKTCDEVVKVRRYD